MYLKTFDSYSSYYFFIDCFIIIYHLSLHGQLLLFFGEVKLGHILHICVLTQKGPVLHDSVALNMIHYHPSRGLLSR